MNLQQLEYIIAIDEQRHFVTAAEKCFVTQATLSMMVKKLEDELDVKIFDRSRQPVKPTREGEEIILRARKILAEVCGLNNFAKELKGEVTGEIHLGVIPTLAPYLLPMFLQSYTKRYPDLKIYIRELVTDEIIARLKMGTLDIGLLATPLNDSQLKEHPLFYEDFLAYAGTQEKLPKKKYLLPKEINPSHLWLLEEGHCFRSQVYNLCELKKHDPHSDGLHYEAGSIETLINMVDRSGGITIVPYLSTLLLKPAQRKKLREFAAPRPAREVSLVTGLNFARTKLLERLAAEISEQIPVEMRQVGKRKVTEVG